MIGSVRLAQLPAGADQAARFIYLFTGLSGDIT